MKGIFKNAVAGFALPVLAFALGGCGGFAVSGDAYTPVYGDYGYVGPWNGGPVVVEGGYFAPPPYGRSDRDDRDHRDGDDRQREAAPERGHDAGHAAPAHSAPPRQIPSIPNQPRPPRQNGDHRKDQH